MKEAYKNGNKIPRYGDIWSMQVTRLITRFSLAVALIAGAQGAVIAAEGGSNTLQDIVFSSLAGDRVQITLTMAEAAQQPEVFTTDDPARLSLDFPGVANAVGKATQSIGIGVVRSVAAIEAEGRTRVVVNMLSLASHTVTTEGNSIILTLGGTAAAAAEAFTEAVSTAASVNYASAGGGRSLSNVDFRRGEGGEGRVVISLTDPSTVVDIREEGDNVVVMFVDASLPAELSRRLDVTDFATPVTTVDTLGDGRDVRMVITAKGEYEHMAYQADNSFVIEFKAISKEEQEAALKKRFKYTGERLSLNFQNIEVRAVLQLLAEFTNLNMVTSDTVSGNLTLRLNNVPWDQAFDIILKTKGLSKRQEGTVVLVAPTEEIAAREKLELEANQQIEELAPLRTEFVQVNYAKAKDLADLLKSQDNKLLSERGNVTVDERTNTLLLQDTANNLEAIRRVVQRLDIPVRQVMIESRIVIAKDSFSKRLGVKLGMSETDKVRNGGQTNYVFGGGVPENPVSTIGTSDYIVTGKLPFREPGSADITDYVPIVGGGDGLDALLVNLPIAGAVGGFNLLVGKIGRRLLRMELTAMQHEGRGEVIASPKVITADQHEAVIKTGKEIPYLEMGSNGGNTVAFKEAVLELKVTPHVTPDDRIIMTLDVKRDNPDWDRAVAGVPPLDKNQVTTQVLVDNGGTVVLGGVFEENTEFSTDKVPLFGDLPYVGNLFRNRVDSNEKKELLIFVTPRILKDTLGLN